MAKVRITLEITAHGYHTVEVEKDAIQHLLNEAGDDFEESEMEELPVAIQNFGLKNFAAIDQAVDFEAVVNDLDFEVSEMELITPKEGVSNVITRRPSREDPDPEDPDPEDH